MGCWVLVGDKGCLRAIPEYDFPRRPEATLIPMPSMWEQRLTTKGLWHPNFSECYVTVESRCAFESRELRLWCHSSFEFGRSHRTLETVSSHGRPSGALRTQSQRQKRELIPRPGGWCGQRQLSTSALWRNEPLTL